MRGSRRFFVARWSPARLPCRVNQPRWRTDRGWRIARLCHGTGTDTNTKTETGAPGRYGPGVAVWIMRVHRAFASGSPPIPRIRSIGRETERAVARARLLDEGVPLRTVSGPGGVGKTRLALQVAADLQEAFADGDAFVPLAAIRGGQPGPAVIAGALGLGGLGSRPMEGRLVEFLQSRQMLLVLGNPERLPDASPRSGWGSAAGDRVTGQSP